MSEKRVTTKHELMEHITRDWSSLNRLLDSLSFHQWTEIVNADGWTVKDHVAHLTAWETSASAFLSGTPRHEALQVSEELFAHGDLDSINRAIFLLHQHDPLDQVLARFRAAHAEMLRLLEPLTDEDLNRPYAHYVPGVDGPPAVNIIYGNTAHHFRTHQAWIEEMLAAAE